MHRIEGGKLSSLLSPDCPVGSDSTTRNFSYEFPFTGVTQPGSQYACLCGRVAQKLGWHGTTRRRFCLTADVSILWTHHSASSNLLPGMRQVAQTGLDVRPLTPKMHYDATEQSGSALRGGIGQTHKYRIPQDFDVDLQPVGTLGSARNSQRRIKHAVDDLRCSRNLVASGL